MCCSHHFMHVQCTLYNVHGRSAGPYAYAYIGVGKHNNNNNKEYM